jgi:glycosidase
VAQQEQDPDSILNFYKAAIRLRKALPVVRHGVYREHFRGCGKVYTYSRETDSEKLLVICSFTEKSAKCRFPKGFDPATAQLLLHNYPTAGSDLSPYECRVYHWNTK